MVKKEQKGFWNSMRKMFGDWKKRSPFHKQSKHSDLEAKHRRLQTWRSVGNFCRGLWDEANVPRRMESFLRKRTRAKEDDRLQEAKEKTYQRYTRLSRLCDAEGYSDLVKFWKQWERTAYMALRHPELRKEGISMDYYIGFQNGILSNVEANRKTFQDAQFAIIKEESKEKEEK